MYVCAPQICGKSPEVGGNSSESTVLPALTWRRFRIRTEPPTIAYGRGALFASRFAIADPAHPMLLAAAEALTVATPATLPIPRGSGELPDPSYAAVSMTTPAR